MQFPWSRYPSELGEESGEPRRRWPLWVVAAVVVLAAAVVVVPYVWVKFDRKLEARSLRQAQAFMQEGEYRRAQLTLEQAVQVNPGNFEARRLLAEFYANAGSPLALDQWRELVRQQPDDVENRLGLARTALALNELSLARDALDDVPASGRETAEYTRLAAAVALLTGDQAELKRQLAALARLEPADERAQFNLAAVELTSPDAAQAEKARGRLLTLARGNPLRIRATLALLREVAQDHGGTRLPALAAAILPPLTERSRMVTATVGRMNHPGFLDLVEHMKQQPDPSAEDAAQLVALMRTQGLAREAAVWLTTLNPVVMKHPLILEARAACAAQLRDWRTLADIVRAGAWGTVSADVVDLAFAARVQREMSSPANAQATWQDAQKLAGTSLPTLRVLPRLATAFGWEDAQERSLWELARAFPRENGAWQMLVATAQARGATDKLLQVYAEWVNKVPEDNAVRAAQLLQAVLLGRWDPSLAESQQRLAAVTPTPPAALAARAWRLAQQGRAEEAAALAPAHSGRGFQDLRQSLAFGLVLSQAGRREDSEKLLATLPMGSLLREERELLAAARTRNAAVLDKP